MGCRAGTPPEVLRGLLAKAEAKAGPTMALATIPAREPEMRDLARALHLVNVAGVATPTQSPRVLAAHGTGSVAEAAALVACGSGARLILTRLISPCGRATIAIAETKEHQ